MSPLDLTTDVVGKSIAVGSEPVAVAVDPVLHTAYVVNSGTGSVSVIDEASARVAATVKVGAKPVAIAVDSTRHLAYVVNKAANSVSILDETTNTVTGTVQVGQGPVSLSSTPQRTPSMSPTPTGGTGASRGSTEPVTRLPRQPRWVSRLLGSPLMPEQALSMSTASLQPRRRWSEQSSRSWTSRRSSRQAPPG